ncbi:MAG: PQQ-dependent sugar dehydrogenase [Geodermatophilaceae bacterium]|nr:PQQ-dependent sugar dehydrogenase [Geodermatophilaceae bacterium]
MGDKRGHVRMVPVVLSVIALLSVVGCSDPAQRTASGPSSTAVSPSLGPDQRLPELVVEVLVEDLDNPWDLAQAPDGTIIFDQRRGGLSAYFPDGSLRAIDADFGDLFARGETGLMGLVLDPGFTDNRRFFTCEGFDGGEGDIRVISWEMAADYAAATRLSDPLVEGMPLTSGRHGGCRLRFDTDGALRISTGDAATGSNAQDLTSLGGKTLRVDPYTGQPWPDNPFLGDGEANPLIYTYGHRNVQGLALRPGTEDMYSAEHGPDVDDEINLLMAGANYGWNPVGEDPDDYNESVPMTDPAIDGAQPAVWASGEPAIATSGSTFLDGPAWGGYDGLLLVGLLAGQGILALQIGEDAALISASRLPGFDGTYGRIRTVQLGNDDSFYVTTSNGDGGDVLLRVTPEL